MSLIKNRNGIDHADRTPTLQDDVENSSRTADAEINLLEHSMRHVVPIGNEEANYVLVGGAVPATGLMAQILLGLPRVVALEFRRHCLASASNGNNLDGTWRWNGPPLKMHCGTHMK